MDRSLKALGFVTCAAILAAVSWYGYSQYKEWKIEQEYNECVQLLSESRAFYAQPQRAMTPTEDKAWFLQSSRYIVWLPACSEKFGLPER